MTRPFSSVSASLPCLRSRAFSPNSFLRQPARAGTGALSSLGDFASEFETLFEARRQEAEDFFDALNPDLSTDLKLIQRRALAGLLWNKQFYYLDMYTWLRGDPGMPNPPESRKSGRNHDWKHFSAAEVLSMPDKWEYPWFAAWDMAFHCVAASIVDPQFAKKQLLMLCREWYMHPNGQIPAYEWAFGDVNPPVHAWCALRLYQIDQRINGAGDIPFLERIFQKLLINFTWWVNRKDVEGNNIFEGGFLGLDNIGVFDRNTMLPDGVVLEQCDGTAWMACFCLNMLQIALELARNNPVYEDVASKFFEHFILIADALNHIGEGVETKLWDHEDGFYYDTLRELDGHQLQLRLHSFVGLTPLFAVMTIEHSDFEKFHEFRKRTEWFLENRPSMVNEVSDFMDDGQDNRHLLALVPTDRLKRLLRRMLDETEFLSPHGLRSLSAIHRDAPYMVDLGNETHAVSYTPGESDTRMFGGNSNWRGPIWFPINYLMIEALQKFDYYYGKDFKIECPTGSGKFLNLWEISVELSMRLVSLYEASPDGERAACARPFSRHGGGGNGLPEGMLFFEYFHGDTGVGLGACQQTGWTALIGKMIQQSGGGREA